MSRLDQRSSLDTLTKARLLEIAASFEVDVVSSHPKAEVIDVLAASKRASFEQILLTLSRDELNVERVSTEVAQLVVRVYRSCGHSG